jgi:hypothetical protein
LDIKDLNAMVEKHKLWLEDSEGGIRADFSMKQLLYSSFVDANLSHANFHSANLSYTDFSGANLRRADFSGAYLSNCNFSGADLFDANFTGANLEGASLKNALLYCTNLGHTTLVDADLSGANLNTANLYCANLKGACIDDISTVKTLMYDLQCPEEGSFIAWKKCKNNVIVKLLIPEDAKRCSATSRKCRASKAIVLEIYGADVAISSHDAKFVYRVGETVEVYDFCDNRWDECSAGIHFYITRKEAEQN